MRPLAPTLLTAAALATCAACGHSSPRAVSAPSETTDPTSGVTSAPPSTAATQVAVQPSPTPPPAPSPTRSASPAPQPRATPSPTPHSTPSPAPRHTPRPTPSPTPTKTGATHVVKMRAPYAFSPSTLTIAVGDSVKVVNDDSTHHTFTDSGVFDSGDLGQGMTFTFRFTKAGTYAFVCSYHDSFGMKGSVKVT